jgi:UDP-N-acetylglucosamine:LPS N-acetylglucosamine transferase
VLAVASAGGHWIQILRLREAFEGMEIVFVSTDREYAADVPGQHFLTIQDASRDRPFLLLKTVWQACRIILVEHPDVVISTGAAPGLLALLFGRLFGAKTIWLDSLANGEELSMSGKLAGYFVGLWLTQWPELANEKGPFYRGSVL